MKTAFMRQLFSGVNFVGRLAGPGENRRGPLPPCTVPLLADRTQAGSSGRAGRAAHSPWTQTPPRPFF